MCAFSEVYDDIHLRAMVDGLDMTDDEKNQIINGNVLVLSCLLRHIYLSMFREELDVLIGFGSFLHIM